MEKIFGLDKDILLLGIVSFLTDVSSEMIFSVFSVFFTVVLGAPVLLLGLVEGLSDFASSSLDYASGFLSDRAGKRKPFAATGYGFSTLAKGILLVASSIQAAAVFRVVERLGKSFRGPPRDAWIARLSEESNRGYAFGVHKALDKAGAVLGPLMAYAVLTYAGQTKSAFTLLFQAAFVPALLAVVLILLMKDKPSKPATRENPFSYVASTGKGLRHYITAAGIFSLAYFSFGFLLLKAYIVGFGIREVVLLYALFNVSFVIASVPAGKLGDAVGRKNVIMLEYVIYLAMSLGFLLAATKPEVIVLFMLFGVFYAIDEGQSKAYVSDLEREMRGTAIGLYNLVTGAVYLPASLIAGWLWGISPGYAFMFAAAVSVVTIIYFFYYGENTRHTTVQA